MVIDLPDHLLKGITLTPEVARLDLAIGLYLDNRVTLGQGAGIAGIAATAFLEELGRHCVPVHYDLEDLRQDAQIVAETPPR
jgi:predicted HTH domain antitoxin